MKESLVSRNTIIKRLLIIAVTMISCVALNLPGTTTQTPPSQTDSNGLIAYVGVDGNLYTINELGENNTSITSGANSSPADDTTLQLYAHPAWSFDGRQLAFVSFESGEGEFLARVLVVNISTAEVTEIFSSDKESPFYLYWDPSGERVSFLTSEAGQGDLFLRFAYLNGDDSQVIDSGQPYYWVWAPDGSKIYIHEGGSISANQDARLTLLSLDDNQAHPIPHAPANFQAPAWSPDGKNLLAAIQDENEKTLVLLDSNGNLIEKLADFDVTLAFSWSPDGEHIAYLPTTLQSRGIWGHLFVIAAESTEILHKTQENNVLAYFWAPDGKKIAFFSVQDLDNNDSEISMQNQETFMLDLKVLDLDTGQTRYLASLRPTPGFFSILPFYDQYHLSATIWSPDSNKIVYTSNTSEQGQGVWVVDVDGASQPVRIADGAYAFWSWK